MATKAVTTTDHEEIREWVEDHGGSPAIADTTGEMPTGVLQVDFHTPNNKEELRDVSWDEFFDVFDRNHLAFVYHESAGAEPEDAHFFKFIPRNDEASIRDAVDEEADVQARAAEEMSELESDVSDDRTESAISPQEADKASAEGIETERDHDKKDKDEDYS